MVQIQSRQYQAYYITVHKACLRSLRRDFLSIVPLCSVYIIFSIVLICVSDVYALCKYLIMCTYLCEVRNYSEALVYFSSACTMHKELCRGWEHIGLLHTQTTQSMIIVIVMMFWNSYFNNPCKYCNIAAWNSPALHLGQHHGIGHPRAPWATCSRQKEESRDTWDFDSAEAQRTNVKSTHIFML